jgi:hypothetical protein
MNNQFVAAWANPLGALVTESVTIAAPAAATAAAATTFAGKVGCRRVNTGVKMTDMCLSR